SANQHELLGEIDRDDGFRPRAMLRRVSTEARQVDNRIFSRKRRELSCGRSAKQGADELAVPGKLGNDLHAHAMLGLRAAEQLLAIEARTVGKIGEEIGLESGKMVGGHRNIGLAPPDGVARLFVLNNELVLGAATRVL